MEIVPIGGLYEVWFNGSAITNCFSDFDCPGGAQICAVNETWSYHAAGQCTCDSSLGFGGFDCDEPGPLTYFVLIVMFITLIVLFISLGEMSIVLSLVLRKQKERKATALTVSVGFATFSSALYFVAVALIINNALWFPTRFRVSTTDGRFPTRTMKTQEHGMVHVTMLILSFIAVTLTMFFLSGVWTNVAIRVQKLLTKQQGQWLQRISLAYLVFALAVLIPTTVLTKFWPISSGIIFAVTLILSLCFAVAAFKIGRVMGDLPKSHAGSHSMSTNDPHTKTGQALRRIHRTALALSSLCLVAAITLGVYGIGPARRAAYIPPVQHIASAPREVAYRLAIFTFSLCNLVVVHYLMRTVQSKVITTGTTVAVSDATSNEVHKSGKQHHEEAMPEVHSDVDQKGREVAISSPRDLS